MQKETFILSDEKPLKDIFFRHGEKSYMITCKEQQENPNTELVYLSLNVSGTTYGEPLIVDNLDKNIEINSQASFLQLKKHEGTLPKEITITVQVF